MSGLRTPSSRAACMPGPVVAHVVGVRAVDDDGHLLFRRHAAQDGIEFVLAEITAVRRVVPERFIRYLVGVDDEVANPDLRCEYARFFEFGCRQGDGASRDGERARAERRRAPPWPRKVLSTPAENATRTLPISSRVCSSLFSFTSGFASLKMSLRSTADPWHILARLASPRATHRHSRLHGV